MFNASLLCDKFQFGLLCEIHTHRAKTQTRNRALGSIGEDEMTTKLSNETPLSCGLLVGKERKGDHYRDIIGERCRRLSQNNGMGWK